MSAWFRGLFADFGHEVTCADKDKAKIDALYRAAVPIYEPGWTELVAANAKSGRLKFTTDLKTAVIAYAVEIYFLDRVIN